MKLGVTILFTTTAAAAGAAGAAGAACAAGQARFDHFLDAESLLGPEVLAEHARLQGGRQPNVVFIITDDQDLHLQSLDYMPYLKKHMRDQGTVYQRHFCTTALCCPARVSLWTGKQAHNTNVTDVNAPYGGYPKFISQGLNDNYLPVWLQSAGYNTYYTGKLFNALSVENYNNPFPAGWNGSDFLLDPYTYSYFNASFQRNRDPPVSYAGQYSVDVLANKTFGFLEDAAVNPDGKPFFLGVAPVAPHSNIEINFGTSSGGGNGLQQVVFTPPVAAGRHAHLFPGVQVPRTPSFNPKEASGAAWVRRLQRQSEDNVAYNDHYYRQRLRALQSVDELVDGLFARLDRLGLLATTYVFFTSDNGFHIGQHRLQPGKQCGYEEDVNVPLIVRGPGVPAGRTTEAVTTHVDLVPTLLWLARAPAAGRADLDGETIPLTAQALDAAAAAADADNADNGSNGNSSSSDDNNRHEHVTIEYWGPASSEGSYGYGDGPDTVPGDNRTVRNNTYKAVRIVGRSYNLYYAVWCSGEHELYNLDKDAYQMNNLLLQPATNGSTILDYPLTKVVARLDALLLVLKSCRGPTCVRPWAALHPDGDVRNLRAALAPAFDKFYEVEQPRVAYTSCELGYLVDAEGPQFEKQGVAFRHGVPWHEWV